MEIVESLRRVAGFVQGWRGPCVLIGGFAIIARVRARPTRDVDLAIKDAFADELDVAYLVDQATVLGVKRELTLYFGFE